MICYIVYWNDKIYVRPSLCLLSPLVSIPEAGALPTFGAGALTLVQAEQNAIEASLAGAWCWLLVVYPLVMAGGWWWWQVVVSCCIPITWAQPVGC